MLKSFFFLVANILFSNFATEYTTTEKNEILHDLHGWKFGGTKGGVEDVEKREREENKAEWLPWTASLMTPAELRVN